MEELILYAQAFLETKYNYDNNNTINAIEVNLFFYSFVQICITIISNFVNHIFFDALLFRKLKPKFNKNKSDQ
jgi:hypothetical protein